jgi:hypothetical protein
MLRGPKAASSYDFERKSSDVDIVKVIGRKLSAKNVKAATVLAYCENLDKNEDNYIHQNDLLEILEHVLGSGSVSLREVRLLSKHLQPTEQGGINYRKFLTLFVDSLSVTKERAQIERWADDEAVHFPKWASKRGSVGEWLKDAACPAEVENFRKFIACLEEFERCSGMKCVHKEDGFVVPLGPNLKTSISFFMS